MFPNGKDVAVIHEIRLDERNNAQSWRDTQMAQTNTTAPQSWIRGIVQWGSQKRQPNMQPSIAV